MAVAMGFQRGKTGEKLAPIAQCHLFKKRSPSGFEVADAPWLGFGTWHRFGMTRFPGVFGLSKGHWPIARVFGTAGLRAVLLFISVLIMAHGQTGDVYERVKGLLGEASASELRAKNFAKVEARLAELKGTSEVLALRGAVEFLDGKMAPAVADFREAAKSKPLNEGDGFTLAMALVRLDDEAGARVVLAGLVKEHENVAIYWYWLGRVDYAERRYREAVENLEKAVKLDPQAARAWDSLGLAWDMQGHLEEARAMFEKAVALNRAQARPSAWPPHNLGYLLLRSGEPGKAEEALRESLRYDAGMAQTHYYLARTLEKENRDEEAIEEYRIAVAGDAKSADSCYSLAMLYRKLHKEAEAAAMFEEFRRRKTAGQNF